MRDQERKTYNRLVDWIKGEKNEQQDSRSNATTGFVHPSLELFSVHYSTAGDGDGGIYRGIRVAAGATISKGTLLARIPAHMTLNGERCPKGAENASPWLRCLVALIHARVRQRSRSGVANKSKTDHGSIDFTPYLESLPEVFNTILDWLADDLKELRGTALHDTILQSSAGTCIAQEEEENLENGMMKACRERFESKIIQGCLNSGGVIHEEEVSFDEFLYATQCISTRGFNMNMHDGEESSSLSPPQVDLPTESSLYRGPFLIPFIDLLNHCSSSDKRKATTLRRDPSDSSFFLETERHLTSEEELLHSYGDLNSHQCLQTFGFVDLGRSRSVLLSAQENCTPAVVFTAEIVAVCKDVATRAEQMQVPFVNFDDDVEIWDPTECWDRKIKFLDEEGVIPTKISLPYSEDIRDELLTCCCVLFLPEEAFDDFIQNPALLDESLLDDTFLFSMVQQAIISIVDKKMTNYEGSYGDKCTTGDDIRELSKLVHEQSQVTCSPILYRKIAALTIRIEEKRCLRCLRNIISHNVGDRHRDKISIIRRDDDLETQISPKRARMS